MVVIFCLKKINFNNMNNDNYIVDWIGLEIESNDDIYLTNISNENENENENENNKIETYYF